MLDRRDVSPGDLFRLDANSGCEDLALLRTGRVAALGYGLDDAVTEPRSRNEIGQADAAFSHPLSDVFHAGHGGGSGKIVRIPKHKPAAQARVIEREPHFRPQIPRWRCGLRFIVVW